MTELTSYTDPMGHTYIVSGDQQVMVSVYGTITIVTLARAREMWKTSARLAAHQPTAESIEAGRRSLRGW